MVGNLRIAAVSFILALGLGQGACTDSPEESQPTTTTAPTPAECRHLIRLKAASRALESPAVFELSAEDLDAGLTQERRLLAVVATETDDAELRGELEDYLARREVTDPASVRLFRDERNLMEQVGWSWDRWAFDQRDLVSQGEHDAFVTPTGAFDLLEARCAHPELAVALEEDPESDPPGGTVIVKELGAGAARGLLAVPMGGGQPFELEPPTGWDELHQPWVDHESGEVLAIASRDDGATAIALGSVVSGFDEVIETEAPTMYCPARSSDGTILVTAQLEHNATVLLAVAPDGNAQRVEVPLTNPICARPTLEGIVVVGGDDVRDFGEVTHLTGRGLSDVTQLSDEPGCNEIVGSVADGDGLVVTARTCPDAGQSGLVVRSLQGGQARLLLAGRVSVPALSPDGEWVTFGHAPLGTNLAEAQQVWVMRQDGTGLRRVIERASTLPVWTADELE